MTKMSDKIIACFEVNPPIEGVCVIYASEHGLSRSDIPFDKHNFDPSLIGDRYWWRIKGKGTNDKVRSAWHKALHKILDGSAGLPDWVEEGSSKYDIYEKIYGKPYKPTVSEIHKDEHSRMMAFFVGKKNTGGCECGAWRDGGAHYSWCRLYKR